MHGCSYGLSTGAFAVLNKVTVTVEYALKLLTVCVWWQSVLSTDADTFQ